MKIKQSVINTFNRVGIPYEQLTTQTNHACPSAETVFNQFGYGSCTTTPLVAACIREVYKIGRAYENGDHSVKVSDFDRIRYFVLEQDSNAYNVCLD
jgi:hypothetical protein